MPQNRELAFALLCRLLLSSGSHSGNFKTKVHFNIGIGCVLETVSAHFRKRDWAIVPGQRGKEGEREGGRERGREGEREGGRERGREGEREGGRERGREGERERRREGEAERERGREEERERGKERQRETERDRERLKETERDRKRQKETERGNTFTVCNVNIMSPHPD